jgi:uncharacterized phiE125 gp8 family phage protein
MYQHRVKTPPVLEPVTLATMRAYLGITQDDDTVRDAFIQSHIKTARESAESYTNTCIFEQTMLAYGSDFPRDCRHDWIDLKSPLQSVTSVTYVDRDGTEQTLDPENYKVDLINHRIFLAWEKKWPEVRTEPNAVLIEYVSGNPIKQITYIDTADDTQTVDLDPGDALPTDIQTMLAIKSGAPEGIINAIECFINLLLRHALLTKLTCNDSLG